MKKKDFICIFSIDYPDLHGKYQKVCRQQRGMFKCEGKKEDRDRCPFWSVQDKL